MRVLIALISSILICATSDAAVIIDSYQVSFGSGPSKIILPNYDNSAGGLIRVEFTAKTHVIIKGQVTSPEHYSITPFVNAAVGPYIVSHYLNYWSDEPAVQEMGWFFATYPFDYVPCDPSSLRCIYESTSIVSAELDLPRYFQDGYLDITEEGYALLENEEVVTISSAWETEGTITYYTSGDLPSVPDAPTWASVLMGFVLIGLLLRHRNQRADRRSFVAASVKLSLGFWWRRNDAPTEPNPSIMDNQVDDSGAADSSPAV